MKMIEKLITTPLKQWSYVQQQFHATKILNQHETSKRVFVQFFLLAAKHPYPHYDQKASNDWVKYLICHGVPAYSPIYPRQAKGVARTRIHTSVESLPRIELTKWSMGRTTFLRD